MANSFDSGVSRISVAEELLEELRGGAEVSDPQRHPAVRELTTRLAMVKLKNVFTVASISERWIIRELD